LFILSNIIVYITVASNQTIGRPHKGGKLFISGALVLNIMYIFPIDKVFGYESVISYPFRILRNFMFEYGISLFPEDDAEGALSWFVVKHVEFEKFVAPEIKKYYEHGDKSDKSEIYLRWTSDMWINLKSIANNTLRDPYLRGKRFNIFVVLSRDYIRNRAAVISRMYGKTRLDNFWKNKTEIDKVSEILKWLIDLRIYARIHEKEGLDHYYNKTYNYFMDTSVIYQSTYFILMNNIYQGQFKCDDPLTVMNIESRKELIEKHAIDPRLPEWLRAIVLRECNSSMHKDLSVKINNMCNKYNLTGC
jgi:hypothetical protein